jgi:hypothetical protein
MQVETSTIVEWTIPTTYSYPRAIAVTGSYVYFAERGGNKIGLLTVSPVATITTFVSKTMAAPASVEAQITLQPPNIETVFGEVKFRGLFYIYGGDGGWGIFFIDVDEILVNYKD